MDLSYENIIGKTMLVGVTYKDHLACVLSQIQFHGVIQDASPEKGIGIFADLSAVKDLIPAHAEKAEAGIFWLPPDLSALSVANPGEYRLRLTGEVVKDPDIISTWVVRQPPPKA